MSGLVPSKLLIVYITRTESDRTKLSPPNLSRTVLVDDGVRVLAEVGYALLCCCLSTTAVLAGGSVKSKLSSIGASPPEEINDSNADMV